jgi:hypothetical protein
MWFGPSFCSLFAGLDFAFSLSILKFWDMEREIDFEKRLGEG